nr:prolyl oligopeptidase family serine peptidase [Nostoc sp. KVJ3]
MSKLTRCYSSTRGPWSRDTWGYDPLAQWLANRGYAVLQVNFRGSTGYGNNSSTPAIGNGLAKCITT